jgi:hypothetical protein
LPGPAETLLLLSRTLNATKNRDELVLALQDLAGQLLPLDSIALSFESPVAESGLSSFSWRMPLAEDSATLLVIRDHSRFTSEEQELLTLIAEQVSTALALQRSRERLARRGTGARHQQHNRREA